MLVCVYIIIQPGWQGCIDSDALFVCLLARAALGPCPAAGPEAEQETPERFMNHIVGAERRCGGADAVNSTMVHIVI